MKKTLLSVAFLFATFVGANAQEISFESSEGYILGDVTGQNDWLTNLVNLPSNPDNPTIDVVNTLFTDGDNSLYFQGTNLPYADTEGNPYFITAVSPEFEVTSDVFEISFDIYVTDILPDAQYASDINIFAESGADEAMTSGIQFNYQGNIRVAEAGSWQDTTVPYNNETWYNVKVLYNFTAGTIGYFLDGTSIFTGTVWTTATTVDILAFQFDNYGNGFYVDNIVIDEDPELSVENFTSTFSVYPNPVKDVLNISNSNGAEINSLTIVDINGRTVRQINSNVSQINISDLNAGVYFVNINSTEGNLTKKVVKQ